MRQIDRQGLATITLTETLTELLTRALVAPQSKILSKIQDPFNSEILMTWLTTARRWKLGKYPKYRGRET
jgi:hypothetical protein